MAGRNAVAAGIVSFESSLISNYVRLCIAEGVKPRDAYRELERRLGALKKLNEPKTL